MKEWPRIETPFVGVGVVVEDVSREKISVIRRKYPPLGYSFPAGMMEIGETIIECGVRETKEETNLDVEVFGLLTAISDPSYDPRWHAVSIWVVGKSVGSNVIEAADDALDAFWMPWENNEILDQMTKGARNVLEDYRKFRLGERNLSSIR